MKSDHESKGYRAGSSGYRHGCRCQECKASNRGYQRTHRGKTDSDSVPRESRVKPAPEIVQKAVRAICEPVASMRDETIPGHIVAALKYQDVVSYVDGGEGWSLTDLAIYLRATEGVDCVIQDDVLYVSVRNQQTYVPVHDDSATGFVSSGVTAVAMTHGAAKPRIVARAKAPSVPGTPTRAPNA